MGFVGGKTLRKPIEYKTQYKVLINESISMAEFNERYEIVGQDGKIYIIEEK
jgi:hypothetical protein